VDVFAAASSAPVPTAGSVGLSSDVHAAIPSAMVAESKVIRLTPFHLSDTVISSRRVTRCIPGTTILQVFHQAHFKRPR
jgi:hypothetical protein